jgi:DNA-binding NarL/FixJ family response regulator
VLPLDVGSDTLRAAIAAVAGGLAVMPPSVARRRLPAGIGASGGDEGPLDEALTEREREVLELVAQGLPNKQIARRLGISDHTVKFHLSTIYGKLGVSSRTEAIGRGVRRGLITL